MSDLRCIEGLSQAAREQIRDRERTRTLEVNLDGRSNRNATVLVVAHFERLIMAGKEVRLDSKFFLRSVSNFQGQKATNRVNRALSVHHFLTSTSMS